MREKKVTFCEEDKRSDRGRKERDRDRERSTWWGFIMLGKQMLDEKERKR